MKRVQVFSLGQNKELKSKHIVPEVIERYPDPHRCCLTSTDRTQDTRVKETCSIHGGIHGVWS